VRKQGQDARECSGAGGKDQQQSDAGKARRMKEEVGNDTLKLKC
jgi:hypothetical protein